MAVPVEASRVPTGPTLDNRRVAAALIDLVVPATLAFAAYAAGLELTAAVVLVIAGWTLFYFFALETDGGQTLGKRAMKLRAARPDGRPADTRQVAIRTALRVVDHPLGLIVMAITGDRRLRLGDLAAGTVITEAEPAADQGTESAPTASMPAAPHVPASLADSPPPSPRPPVPPAPMARPAPVGPPPPVPRAPRPPAAPAVPPMPTRVEPPATPAPVAEDREPVVEPRWDEVSIVEPRWDEDPVVAEHEPVVEPLMDLDFDDEPGFDREPVVEPLPGPRAYDDPAELPSELVGDEEADEEDPAPASPRGRDDPIVKPIQTISAIDLVMQDAQQRDRAAGDSRG
jgi:uncharacterized RDD family membrane protein YckC